MDVVEGDYPPDPRTVKARLLQKYGDDISIVVTHKRTIVCFRNTGFKILTDSWYASKKTNAEEERLRVVRAAANILLEDIRSQVYETKKYPPSDIFLEDVDTVILETLLCFLEQVIVKHKRCSVDKWRIKCKAIAHAIISAARPWSFLSPLQIGVGTLSLIHI